MQAQTNIYGKKPLQIAIDGPIGSGKSTVAGLLAEKLNLFLVDAGALYRAAAYLAMRDGLTPEEYLEIAKRYRKAKVIEGVAEGIGKQIKITLDGEDISDKIRTHGIDDLVAKIAKNKEVIDAVHEKEREIAKARSVVIEGREIGSVVLREAQVKIYLTAGMRKRAQRRIEEYRAKGDQTPEEHIIRSLKERDELDMRRLYAPLIKADDTVLIDTTEITAEEAADKIIKLVPSEYLGYI